MSACLSFHDGGGHSRSVPGSTGSLEVAIQA